MDGIPKVLCPVIISAKKKAKLRLYVYSLRANGFTLAVNPLEIGSADDMWARQNNMMFFLPENVRKLSRRLFP